jgi:tetratricopeptide (TPR) repeat protein
MRNVLIVGSSPDERRRLSRTRIPATHTQVVLDSRTLPFAGPDAIPRPSVPRALMVDEVERAFPDAQAGGTRLVLTQSTYLLQTWIDALEDDDRVVATADREALERCAPEALQRRGPWSDFDIVDLDGDCGLSTANSGQADRERPAPSPQPPVANAQLPAPGPQPPTPSPLAEALARAFDTTASEERLRLCDEATRSDPQSAVAWLALASACRERRDGTAARDALERAAALAPDWEAIAYESGKLWLVYDDLARARDAFQRAADLMPTFSAAWSNLGATLGELDEPAAALDAFRRALAHDARSVTLLNNIGVVCRKLGQLADSETALRRAVAASPAFVFAHYNLGHTLFLAGRYQEALAAYEQGRRIDPQQNRRQGCRLAIVRLATGDAAGAQVELWRCIDGAPPDEREDLLLEAYEVAHALLTLQPALDAHRPFLDRIGAEITKSE